jgi:hypothetical protein
MTKMQTPKASMVSTIEKQRHRITEWRLGEAGWRLAGGHRVRKATLARREGGWSRGTAARGAAELQARQRQRPHCLDARLGHLIAAAVYRCTPWALRYHTRVCGLHVVRLTCGGCTFLVPPRFRFTRTCRAVVCACVLHRNDDWSVLILAA